MLWLVLCACCLGLSWQLAAVCCTVDAVQVLWCCAPTVTLLVCFDEATLVSY